MQMLLGLTGLRNLDVSGNNFSKLPWINICLMTNLVRYGLARLHACTATRAREFLIFQILVSCLQPGVRRL